jgi:hypothetical protein
LAPITHCPFEQKNARTKETDDVGKKTPVCTRGNSMKSNMQTKEVEIYLMQQVVDQHLLL